MTKDTTRATYVILDCIKDFINIQFSHITYFALSNNIQRVLPFDHN